MNIIETIKAIQIMQAFVDGKAVEWREVTEDEKEIDWSKVNDGKWKPMTFPFWNWSRYVYRIKPTTTLRPWTADEVPLGAWIRSKKHSWGSLIIAVRPDGTFEISDRRISPESALEQNEHSTDGGKTWLPCGVMEESK